MNREFKRYMYIIGTICIIFLVGSLILHILPWLLIAGVIIYIVMKIVGFFKEKKRKKNLNNYYNNDRDKEVYSTPVDDYTTGEIIDVEYEDVDKKEK
ncbi:MULTISPECIES: hypothetical protein [Clostridium]|jgi:hypothetical protein|uniref:Large-conductance mechanosensitive channel n=4 Tax=Clostridium TaxID=1485 RepID=A0A0B5QJZ1_CLOBE|nr:MULTISPECIES: hypothetical protein [Clostridium]ABR36311.1 hypothetical protein Cbei_4201 [Clostridium beijerinckii NCIMB 8052]AIU05157.1 hypothetical protein Cbs_4201 [Clostridium beijerinckii ATCC 35702]AJH01241.1 hypothetical protein LF65_04710 [Clostridium beijerinckii]ALB44624.1 hypothetical protein X276_04680 [Clostridium beijerinckii NRRL B-598]AQS07049.1 hypothetical protein CLBIJ_44990 [Clostridium beijerinckii]